ncbi:MAG: hypothetical protein ACK5IP_12900 [Paracoccus sp. (in: a-proteobacteria)]
MLGRVLMILGSLAGVGGVFPPLPVLAQAADATGELPEADVEAQLWLALRLPEMMQVMQEEALSQADEMAGMLFQRGTDAGWRERVAAIHDPARVTAMLRPALTGTLADLPAAEGRAALDFLRTPLGQQVVQLELQARRAIIDQDTEDGAIEAYRQARAIGSPRLRQIDRLIGAADLMEPAIAAALNEALAFSRGFAAEGGFQIPMTETEMLAQTWAQEPEIRTMIEEWLPAYLLLAYSPLSDEDLARYVDFGTSGAGRALWMALNDAYEEVYTRISREMGEAAALHISGRQL